MYILINCFIFYKKNVHDSKTISLKPKDAPTYFCVHVVTLKFSC